MENIALDGIMGLVVGDALGVPVEFNDRKSLKDNPVTTMREYGTYSQPAGTWSDDSSMTLCLLESLNSGLNYHDIMDNFVKWFDAGKFTPHGEVFDIGNTTREALTKYSEGMPPLECGGLSDYDNGNGSLMRILPILFYVEKIYGENFHEHEKAFEIIHNISSLTHQHQRSHIACGIYICIAAQLLNKNDLEKSINVGIVNAMKYYKNKKEYNSEIKHFMYLEKVDFKNMSVDKVKSGGYVLDTLNAAIWCLINTESYKSCVLKAVNLGSDTDTTAAVAGGLAGIYYGYKNIPSVWLEKIVKRKDIENLCNNFYYIYIKDFDNTPEKREWQTVWKADIDVDMRVESLEAPKNIIRGGQQHKMFRFVSANNLDGAVVIVEKNEKIALVKHNRPSIEQISLELPQGMGDIKDNDGIETGMREAREELGVEVSNGVNIGQLYADSAITGNRINVICCQYTKDLKENDGEVISVHWLDKMELLNLLKANKIKDGISMSALLLYYIYKNDV